MPSKRKRSVAKARLRKAVGPALGCGVDVVELSRFERSMKSGGRSFMRRIFTAQEEAYAKARKRTTLKHLAGRFAAKEAVLKALSQMDSKGRVPAMNQVEIRNDTFGRPSVKLHDGRKRRLKAYVSLSHVDTIAVASAIVTR